MVFIPFWFSNMHTSLLLLQALLKLPHCFFSHIAVESVLALAPVCGGRRKKLSSASVAVAASTRVAELSIMILCGISSFELPSPPHPVLLSLITHILSVAASVIHD